MAYISRPYIEYSVRLNSSNPEGFDLIQMPISNSSDLQNNIHIKSGTGQLYLNETLHGTALQINFTGIIEIYGNVSIYLKIGSLEEHLTMVNQTEADYRKIQYWI